MFELIDQIIFDITGSRGITMDTDFIQDLGLNSFDIVNIVNAVEEHYNIVIPTRDIWNLHKVSDVLNYMEKRGIH